MCTHVDARGVACVVRARECSRACVWCALSVHVHVCRRVCAGTSLSKSMSEIMPQEEDSMPNTGAWPCTRVYIILSIFVSCSVDVRMRPGHAPGGG